MVYSSPNRKRHASFALPRSQGVMSTEDTIPDVSSGQVSKRILSALAGALIKSKALIVTKDNLEDSISAVASLCEWDFVRLQVRKRHIQNV